MVDEKGKEELEIVDEDVEITTEEKTEDKKKVEDKEKVEIVEETNAEDEEEKEAEEETDEEAGEEEEEPEVKKKAKKVRKKKRGRGVVKGRAKVKGEDVEIVEELPRVKPEVSKEVKELLALRHALKSKKPEFKRQEWFRYRRLGTAWRRPQGMHSKMRRHFRYRVNVVSVGYGSPSSIRSYHPSGFQEKRVHNINDLNGIDPKTHAVRIAHSVGAKKRLDIIEKADEEGIRVLNRGMWYEEEEEEKKEKAKEKGKEEKKEGKPGGAKK